MWKSNNKHDIPNPNHVQSLRSASVYVFYKNTNFKRCHQISLQILSELEGITSFLKQTLYPKFKWLQPDSNPPPLSKRKLNRLAKLAKWLSCVVSIYLYGALIMSSMRFTLNLHSLVAWMSPNSLLETGAISEF